jgi:hypothetical protein
MRVKQALQAFGGLLAALLSAILVLSVIFGFLISFDSAETSFTDVWGFTHSVAYITAIYVLPVVLVGGFILYFAYRRFGWFKPGQSAAGGAVLGATVFPINLIASDLWRGLFSLETLGASLLGTLAGAIGGLVFWWIAARPLDPKADS